MAIGQALREAREIHGLTQEAAGRIGYISSKMISAMETGRRSISPDTLQRLADGFDDSRFYLEAAASITGGVFVSPWLDGDSVDLHRSSVRAKAIEELHEALDTISEIDLINRPDHSRAFEVEAQLLQVLDAETALEHLIAVLCKDFGISPRSLYRKHREKLRERGYIHRR